MNTVYRLFNSYNLVSMSALVGMIVDMHLYYPCWEEEITSWGLGIGMVLFVAGIIVHKKEVS